jgi:drug/metabolite transporter (DMT)-like permease
MSALDVMYHLLNFVAPAFSVATLLALFLWWRAQHVRVRTWRPWAWLSAAGVLVLLIGLAWFGRDGKLVTYAAMVTLQGTLCAWWRRR